MKELKYIIVNISLFLWFSSTANADLLNSFVYTGGNQLYSENTIADNETAVDNTQSKFKCSKKLCKEMVSCEEACYQFKTCGYTQLDSDRDDIPCESICSSPCPADKK